MKSPVADAIRRSVCCKKGENDDAVGVRILRVHEIRESNIYQDAESLGLWF
jgi:hypothetical protein